MPKLYSKTENQVNVVSSEGLKPRAHIVSNLLNYSKSLQVETMTNGKKTVIHLN
ncbi:MAG: hypothetical protein ACK46R_15080 [Bacteroidota bacterium]|jgi:hypothetical protein